MELVVTISPLGSNGTLVIIDGLATLQIGGEGGKYYEVLKGDVIILPAGVAHRCVTATEDFKCIGAYPTEEDCDMQYGKAEEHPKVDENIAKVGLPKSDPVFGASGLSHWKLGLFGQGVECRSKIECSPEVGPSAQRS